MNDPKMSMKAYTKFDKTFMIFGSMMNGMQGYLTKTEAVGSTIKMLWDLSKSFVSDYVDEMYKPEEKLVDLNAEAVDMFRNKNNNK